MTTVAKALVNPEEIRKIVWGFANMVRDKGNGTVEDYAKVVLPTCLLKRTLDLQTEFNSENGKSFFDLVEAGVSSAEQALIDINAMSYKFYDINKIKKECIQTSITLISWKDLMKYKENPNGEEVTISLPFNQEYKTKAVDFIELMFEIINVFNEKIEHVFNTFEYKKLIIQNKIVPTEDFYKTCHNELSKYDFNMKNITTDIFSDIYMDLIGRFAADSGKSGGEFFTPTLLVKNAWRLIDIDEMANKLVSGEKTSLSIGDPTAGSNTFLIYGYDEIMKKCEELAPGKVNKQTFSFYGQELKNFQYCLGLINMIFHNTIDSYNQGIPFECQNANVIDKYFTGIGSMRGMLDIVVANPPYGGTDYGVAYAESTKTTDPRWKAGVPKQGEKEFAFMMTIEDLLNKTGKAVVVMPLGTLFRNTGKQFRKYLLDNDLVEGLVALPKNMFATTGIPVVLWVLNKKKKDQDKGKVFMVNATKDFIKVGKFNEWQPEKSIQSYLSRSAIEDYSGYADYVSIEKNNFNLSIQRYYGEIEEEEWVDIEELECEIELVEKRLHEKRSIINSLVGKVRLLEGDL